MFKELKETSERHKDGVILGWRDRERTNHGEPGPWGATDGL